MKFKNKRVFISGGAGVIGAELVDLLIKEGAVVWVGDLKRRPDNFPKEVIYRQGDLNTLTQGEVNEFVPEVFFHLAATFERSEESYEFWEENYTHNLKLSHHLMGILKEVPSVEVVVFASSYLIYEPSLYLSEKPLEKVCSLGEKSAINPRNLTGAAKLMHEVELGFLQTFLGERCRFIMARIFRGYGKGSRDIISRWVRDLIKQRPIHLYGKENRFDYIYSQDTAEGLMRLAQCKEAIGVYNLGMGKAQSVSDVIVVLKKYFPKAYVIEKIEKSLCEASEADMSKTLKRIGWVPSTSLEEAIGQIIIYEKEKFNCAQESFLNAPGVLITSLSRKVPLIKAVREAAQKCFKTFVLWGADTDAQCIGKAFVDCFWEMPSLNNLGSYELIEFCKTNKISCIIPTRDGELEFFSRQKQALEEHGVAVLVSGIKGIRTCLDKWEFYKFLSPLGFSIPQTRLSLDETSWENYVVKERFGAGAQSIAIGVTKEQAAIHAKKMEEPLFQQYVKGIEFSADVYIDRKRNTKGVILRFRDKVVGGESQVTTTFIDEQLKEYVSELAQALNLYGHVVVQGILQENGDVCFIEVNARFGGASTLGIKAGLDSFYWFLLEALGNDLDEIAFTENRQPLRMIRYPQDEVFTITENLQPLMALQS